MFKKSFFHNQSSSLGAIILAIAYAGSYILGLLRDRALAHYFPTTIKETYDAAFQVPDLIFNFFAAGLLSATIFLPIFRELVEKKDEEKAYILTSALLNLISLATIIIATVCFFAMPYLTRLIVPGFPPDKQIMVANLSRIMLFSPLFFATSNIIGNILYSFKRFFSYGFAILLYNSSIIISIILWQENLGIYSAAIGLVIGVFLQLLFRLIELIFTPFRYKFTLNLKTPEFWQLIKLAIPKTLGQLTWQGNLFIFNRVGSLLVAGSLSAFNYARNIQSFPVSFFGISLASAVFPDLASYASKKDKARLEKTFQKSFGQILFFTLPAAFGLAYLSRLVIGLILKTGAFGDSDLEKTSFALIFFALSIPAESLVHLFARLFYAHKKVWTPVLISTGAMCLNIVLSYQLACKTGLGAAGLALSFTIFTYFQLLLLFILSQCTLLKFHPAKFISKILKFFSASFVMLLTIYLARNFLPTENIIWQTFSLITLGGLAYLLTSFILRCEELDFLIRQAKPQL